MTNEEIIEKCTCGLSEDIDGEFYQLYDANKICELKDEQYKIKIDELYKKLKGKTANADLYNEVEEVLNKDYIRLQRLLKESEEREKIARKVINDLRKKMMDEEVVKNVLDAHAEVLKKATKGNIIELIVEELKK